MEQVLKHGYLSLVLLIIGVAFYLILNFLVESVRKGELEQKYETAAENKERINVKKKVERVYGVLLVWLIVIINIVIYFI